MKTVWVHAHGGSNPSHSANARRVGNPAHRAFSLSKAEGVEQERRRKAAKKVAGGKFLATDRSNLQSTSCEFR